MIGVPCVAVDFWTDLAFVATLYIFSKPGDPGDSFLDVLAETVAVPGEEPRDLDFFFALFVVGALTMLLNIVLRIVIFIQQCYKYRAYINTRKDYFMIAFALPVIMVEPHNGLLYFSSIIRDEAEPLSEYDYNKREVKINTFLLMLEDVPQFIVQILFWAQVKKGSLTVTWYLSTVVSVLKLTSAGVGIIITLYQLRQAKAQDEKSASIAAA
ncbi:Hypothetical Protein FCC1311_108242 [Hondaea fermentalgiana]|uniref:Uncharacterized protein n=1 Tax=Hondaea fermentalgiana TaxID=2315210 RepID=A0A2R5H0L7_9STRA|nr:Hypothetical Protein FCC1311_108242 [Hondaea fermentalgiana]|eukprot:GBG34603.1 Hypothetical Protein FCC1311_108242 [Hondaea fermentalgiana]